MANTSHLQAEKFRSYRVLRLIRVCGCAVALWVSSIAVAAQPSSATAKRMFEATFESAKTYPDPFNDVELDVIFSKGTQT